MTKAKSNCESDCSVMKRRAPPSRSAHMKSNSSVAASLGWNSTIGCKRRTKSSLLWLPKKCGAALNCLPRQIHKRGLWHRVMKRKVRTAGHAVQGFNHVAHAPDRPWLRNPGRGRLRRRNRSRGRHPNPPRRVRKKTKFDQTAATEEKPPKKGARLIKRSKPANGGPA